MTLEAHDYEFSYPQIFLAVHFLPSYCSPWGVSTVTVWKGSRDREYSITRRISRLE